MAATLATMLPAPNRHISVHIQERRAKGPLEISQNHPRINPQCGPNARRTRLVRIRARCRCAAPPSQARQRQRLGRVNIVAARRVRRGGLLRQWLGLGVDP